MAHTRMATSRPSLLGAVWLVPLLAILYNAEKALSAVPAHANPSMNAIALAVGVGVTGLIAGAAAWLARKGGAWNAPVLGLQAMLCFDGLSVLVAALRSRGYVPGLVVAALALLPGSIWLFREAARRQVLSRRWVAGLAAAALLAYLASSWLWPKLAAYIESCTGCA